MTRTKRLLVVASAITALVLLGVAGFAGGAVADEVTVDAESGEDGNEENPYATIQAAVDAAQSDDAIDTIVVESGTYGAVNVDVDGLTIEAAGAKEETTITHSADDGTPTVAIDAENVVLSGFTIERGGSSTAAAQGVRVAAPGVEVRNNHIEHTSSDDQTDNGVLVSDRDSNGDPVDTDVSNVLVDGNTISRFPVGVAVATQEDDENTVRNLDVSDNRLKNNGVGVGFSQVAGATDLGDGLSIDANTVDGNGYGIYIFGDDDSEDHSLTLENVRTDGISIENNDFLNPDSDLASDGREPLHIVNNGNEESEDAEGPIPDTIVEDNGEFDGAVRFDDDVVAPEIQPVIDEFVEDEGIEDDEPEEETIVVSPGTYDDVTIDEPLVTLEGPNAGLDGASQERGPEATIEGRLQVKADDVTVRGFTVSPTSTFTADSSSPLAGIFVNGNNVLVENNRVSGMDGDAATGEDPVTINGIQVFKQGPERLQDITISDNLVEDIDNSGGADWPDYGGAVGIKIQNQLDDVDVRGNTIRQIHSAGWSYGITSTPSSSNSVQPTNVVIEENRIESVGNGDRYEVFADDTAPYPGAAISLDTADGGSEENPDADATELTVTENSILDTPIGVHNKDLSATLTATHNYWGSPTGPNGDGSRTIGDVETDPWYLDEDRETLSNELGDTIVVDADGGGDVTDIQAALDLIELTNAEISTIEVRSGTYEESPTIDVSGLTVRAAEDANPEIRGIVTIAKPEVTVDGFTIDGGDEDAAPLNVQAGSATITDNTIEGGSDAGGISTWAGPGPVDGTVVIESNRIENGPIGLVVDGDSTVDIRDNEIDGATSEAIWLSDFTDSASISEADITIEDNDIGSVALADVKVETTAPASLNGNSDLENPSNVAVQFLKDSNAETVTLWNGQTYDENGNIVVQEGDSIQDAIDNAGEDETIVLDGEFEEDVTVDQPGLTIEGTDDATIVGQSTGYGGALEIAADDVSVSGLTVDATGEAGVYVKSGTEGFHLTDSTIRTASSPDGRPNGLLFETGGTDNHHIEGNAFENEADASENPILAYVNGEVSGPTESTNVSFVDNTFTGGSVGGGMALGHEAADSEITGNTFEVSSDYGQLEVWVADTTIENNEFGSVAGFHLRDAGSNVDDSVLTANDFEGAVLVDETSDGSQKVFGTLQAALADTAEGATVRLTADVFDGAATIDTADVTIEGPNAGLAGDSDDRSDEATLEVNGNHEIAAEGVSIDGVSYEISEGDNGVEVSEDAVSIQNSVFDAPTVENFDSGSGYGIWIDGASGTTVEANHFTGGNGGVQIAGDSSETTVEGNVIDSDVTGIGQGSATQDAVTETSIEGNTITVGVQAVSGWKADDMVVADNSIVVDDAAYEGRSSFTTERGIDISGDNVSVTENDISSTDTAVLVESAAGPDVQVLRNTLAGDEFAVDASSYTETLDAAENYWGADTGPGGEGPGDGDTVSENVEFEPFLDAPFNEGGEPTQPTAFEVTNFEVDAEEVPVGERITAELTVENTGDVAGVKPISIEADGETIEEFGVEGGVALGSGATFTEEVTFTPGSEGNLELTVDATDETVSEPITVTEAETTFDVGETEVSSEEALPGEEVTVSATVTNTGTVEGTRTVDLERTVERENGDEIETVDSADVTLGAGESTTVELTDVPSVSLEGSEATYTVETPTGDQDVESVEILESATVEIDESTLGQLGSVVVGETTTVEATVDNTGGVDTTDTVQLTADGSTVAETDEAIASGESRTVELEIDTADLSADTYDLALRTSDETVREPGALEVQTPAEFIPTVGSVTDPEAGDDIEVDVAVENVGDASASGEVELLVPGVGSETVETDELAYGESETVTLTVATDEDAVGERSFFVATDDETVDGETEVLTPPELDVDIESATDPLIAEQDSLAVDVAVENDGGVEAENVEVDLALSGEDDATETVSIAGDSEETVTFDEIDVGEALEGDLELTATATYDGSAVDDTETVTVLEAPEDALFRVSEFTVTDNTPRDDVLRTDSGTIDVEATIENVGDLEGTQEVPLMVDGEPVTTENSLTLDGGESITDEFAIDANELRTGDRTISAETNDSDRSSTVTVRDPTPATFEVDGDDTTDSLDRGDTVEATVENVGDLEGTQSVSVEIQAGDETLTTSTEDVTLGLDETTTVKVAVPDAPRAGVTDATVHVSTDDAADSVETTIDFGSISDGLDAAESGDTVHVASGDYDEEVTLEESGVTLSGDDATFTSSGTAVSITADDVTVEGFDFEQADIGVEITGDDATVQSSRFFGSVTNGIEIRAADATIKNNRFDGLDDTAIVLTDGADDGTIENNNILDGHLGIYADAGFHVVEDNNIERNRHAAIDADRPFADSITEIDATNNYWGRPGGPREDEILSPVATEPFLTEPNEDPDYRITDSNLGEIGETVEGEPVEVSYTVENVGGTAGSDIADTLVLTLDGETVAETDAFEIGSGQSLSNDDSELGTLTFEVDTSTAARLDSAQLELSTDDDASSKSVDVLTAADLEATITDVPDELETDEALSVEATIENSGETAGTETVDLRFDGTTVDSEEVTVAGGSDTVVTLSTELDESDIGTDMLVDVLPTDSRYATVTVREASDPDPVGSIGGGSSLPDSDAPDTDDSDSEPDEPTDSDEPTDDTSDSDDSDTGSDADADSSDSDTPEPTEPDETPIDEPAELPGFGAGVAVIALLAAALMARYRR